MDDEARRAATSASSAGSTAWSTPSAKTWAWVTSPRGAAAARSAVATAVLMRRAPGPVVPASEAPAWYSTESPVRRMKASSSEACCGVSSCRTSAVLRGDLADALAGQAVDLEHAALGAGDRRRRRPTSASRSARRLGRADAHGGVLRGLGDDLGDASCRRSAGRARSTIRCSAVSAISLIRCEERKTVRPSAARPLSRLRIHRMPSGSRPLAGSSRMTVSGSPSSAEAMPSRWPMPSEKPPTRLRATACEADELDDLVDARARDAVRLGHGQQVVVGAAAGVDGAGLEHRADLVQRRAAGRGRPCR